MICKQGFKKIQKRETFTKVSRFFVFIFIGTSILSLFAKKKPVLSMVDRQCEAQMVSIPLPVGGVLIPAKAESKAKKGSSLTYSVASKREALIRFYDEEMMRLGWNKLAQSSGDEEVLVFESPSKIALIEMRPEKPKKGWKRSKKVILKLHEMSKENEAGVSF